MNDKLSFEDRADQTLDAAEAFIDELEARYDVTPEESDNDDEHFTSAYQVFGASTMRLLTYGWTMDELKAEVANIAEVHEDILADLDIHRPATGPDAIQTMRKLRLISGGEGQ